VILVTLKENISKKISNVALLTFEGAAFNVTFLTLLLILVYPLTMVLKQQ
jgi:Na+-transporting methylmalonyl-CoA/oxaloacetate decarboxylase gamma subunit